MCYNRSTLIERIILKDPLRHLPFALVIFLIVTLGFADLSVAADSRTFVTILAPTLWLGVYLLFGTDRD